LSEGPEHPPASGGPGPCLGLDLGEARIGVAVTDSARTVAVPRSVLARSGDETADHAAIARLVADVGATLVVVGVPLGLDGGVGAAAAQAASEAARLRATLDVPVATVDERLSTVEAARRRREADPARRGPADRPRPRRPVGRRRPPVDAGAAAVILQAFIDRERRR
jgi:putative Holliday junction resolvase